MGSIIQLLRHEQVITRKHSINNRLIYNKNLISNFDIKSKILMFNEQKKMKKHLEENITSRINGCCG